MPPQTVNPPPYCAELYNPEQLPYAFYYFPMKNKDSGFPVWFDINLGAGDAVQWASYVQEGLYLDSHTQVGEDEAGRDRREQRVKEGIGTNLRADDLVQWAGYVQQGLYLDPHTQVG